MGTAGETRTVDYLTDQYRQMGLLPGNPDGSYVQAVPLTRFVSHPEAAITVAGARMPLKYPDDHVAFSYERRSEVRLPDSELVFVGYGVKAPEYDWDDFKGRDLQGKTLVVLINDPQIPDPADPARLDPAMFKGKAMTYYGRWTYKYETAAALGAAAVLIVHETATAAYPYSVVVNSWSRDNFDLNRTGPNPNFPPVAAWITQDRARAVFSAAGLDFDALKRSAVRRDFQPVALNARLDITVHNEWQDISSRNVVGLIEGSDPALKGQYVLYSAHWDHFGWDPKLPGTKHEQIFHGALDNASGVAALLELARAFRALPALYIKPGDDYIGKPSGFGKQHKDAYTANIYHKVTDVVDPEWDTSGAVEDIGLLFDVGYGVAQGERFPQWNAGTEFKARRDRMMSGAGR